MASGSERIVWFFVCSFLAWIDKDIKKERALFLFFTLILSGGGCGRLVVVVVVVQKLYRIVLEPIKKKMGAKNLRDFRSATLLSSHLTGLALAVWCGVRRSKTYSRKDLCKILEPNIVQNKVQNFWKSSEICRFHNCYKLRVICKGPESLFLLKVQKHLAKSWPDFGQILRFLLTFLDTYPNLLWTLLQQPYYFPLH